MSNIIVGLAGVNAAAVFLLSNSALFHLSSVLWLIWGLVHVFAGVITMYKVQAPNEGIAAACSGILDKVPEAKIRAVNYPTPVGGLISQHGFNLAWIGVVTTACAVPIWSGSVNAVVLASLTGGLTDLGYFLFVDIPGYSNPPGPQMTWICLTAVVTGVYATGAN